MVDRATSCVTLTFTLSVTVAVTLIVCTGGVAVSVTVCRIGRFTVSVWVWVSVTVTVSVCAEDSTGWVCISSSWLRWTVLAEELEIPIEDKAKDVGAEGGIVPIKAPSVSTTTVMVATTEVMTVVPSGLRWPAANVTLA